MNAHTTVPNNAPMPVRGSSANMTERDMGPMFAGMAIGIAVGIMVPWIASAIVHRASRDVVACLSPMALPSGGFGLSIAGTVL